MKLYTTLLSLLLLACIGCDNELNFHSLEQDSNVPENRNSLNISVSTDVYQTKSVNLTNSLPNGSQIGLFLRNADPEEVVQLDVRNACFEAKAAAEDQLWETDQTVYLNNELCNVYAYYPYNPDVNDVTAIPVSTENQIDYLYNGKDIKVNTTNNKASLEMEHALAVITLNIQRGTYAGIGEITRVDFVGSGIAKSATLNAETGELSNFQGVNETVSQDISLTMNESGQVVHTLIVPNNVTSTSRISLWVDGNVYHISTPSVTYQQGNRYEYTLTIDEDEMGLLDVHIGDWTYNGLGNLQMWAGSYLVTFEGDYSDIYFNNSSSGSTIQIKAAGLNNVPAWIVSATGDVTMTQSAADGVRTILLTDIASKVTVTFNGLDHWYTIPDGIYAIASNFEPIEISNATDDCIGVGLVNSATNQRLMIEKFENENNPESVDLYTNAAQALGSTYTYQFSWGGYGSNAGTFVSNQVGAGSTSSTGGNFKSDGSDLNLDPSTWITSGGALSDFGGKFNSSILKDLKDNGTYSSNLSPMSFLMNAFNDSNCPRTVNQGFTDWFVPSCGQSGLILLNNTDVNTCLTAIGGTKLFNTYYNTSTELDPNNYWLVTYGSNSVGYAMFKPMGCRVRLVRELKF